MTIKNPLTSPHRIFCRSLPGPLCYASVLIVLGLLTGGCGLVGAFYGVFIDPLIPPKTIQAEHHFSKKKVLVWVDAPLAMEMTSQLQRELTQALTEHLKEHKAIGDTVNYSDIARFRYAHPNYAQMSIQQLGQSFEAEEVMYVIIENFSLHYETGAGYYRPQINGYLKIIDSTSGKRVWPTKLNQQTFDLTEKLSRDLSEHEQDTIIRELCIKLSEEIGPFFYDHPQPKS